MKRIFHGVERSAVRWTSEGMSTLTNLPAASADSTQFSCNPINPVFSFRAYRSARDSVGLYDSVPCIRNHGSREAFIFGILDVLVQLFLILDSENHFFAAFVSPLLHQLLIALQ